MSWSISKLYRSPEEVVQNIHKENLPESICTYIVTAADELERLRSKLLGVTEAPMVLVHGHGHLCHEGPGGGNYEVTSAKLVVVPLRFGQVLSLPLAVV